MADLMADRVADRSEIPGERIPMVVLGGWLGSGKTTLVNRLLSVAPAGERIAVVVNDIGDVDIDAGLIAARHGDTVELSNGCVCCSIGDSLATTLRDLVMTDRPLDRIVVEASGVAEPGRVAAYGDRRRIRPDGVVVCVDAVDVVARSDSHRVGELVRRQVATADVLILTKTDLLDDGGRAARGWCCEHAPDTPVIAAVDADRWVAVVLAGADVDDAGPSEPADALDLPIATRTWIAPDGADAENVADALRLVSDAEPSIIRAKGVFGGSAVHLAGGRVTIDPVVGAHPAEGRLVLVASPDWDAERVVGALGRACTEMHDA